MELGIDRLHQNRDLGKKKIGLLAHAASYTTNGIHTLTHLLNAGLTITTLFGPEHGFDTIAQDMESVDSGYSQKGQRKIPTYSLYGRSETSLHPTEEMLANIDVMIVDLQDIGSRYYTYIYTMAFMMKACAQHGIPVIVCDRPNPITGSTIEGNTVQDGYHSFVGAYPLPARHGMTIGELAQFFNSEYHIGCDLMVISMKGWKRDMFWDENGLKWINPSPNMRSLEAALLYPGVCLLEATNLSEGRGTERPFEYIGAPWIEAQKWTAALNQLDLPGLAYHPISFTPTFQKWRGQRCEGLHVQITDRTKLSSYKNGLALIWTLYHLFKEKGFMWRSEPYEFVADIPAIDLLTGSDHFRRDIHEENFESLVAPHLQPPDDFLLARQRHLLY